MKFLITKFIKSNKGISLIEVLVAGAIMAGISMYLARISQNADQQVKSAEMKFNAISVLDKIYRDLSSANVCSSTIFSHNGPNYTIDSLVNNINNNNPTQISGAKVKESLKITDFSGCDTMDDNNIVYTNPPLTEKQNCLKILEQPYGRESLYLKQCAKHINGKTLEQCYSEFPAFFGNITVQGVVQDTGVLDEGKHLKELYKKNDLIDNIKLDKIEIVKVEDGASPDEKYLTIKITVDVRGNSRIQPLGSPTKSKLFTLKARTQETFLGETPTICYGKFSEESAVEKACTAMGGTYNGIKCNTPNILKNCQRRFAAYIYNPPSNSDTTFLFRYNSDGDVEGINVNNYDSIGHSRINNYHNVNSQLFSSMNYQINNSGKPSLNGTHFSNLNPDTGGQNLKYLMLTASVCLSNETAISAFGACSKSFGGKKYNNDVGIMFPALISRSGSHEGKNVSYKWTIGCALPNHIITSEQLIGVYQSMCCESETVLDTI